MDRQQKSIIIQDLERKMVFLAGPRQVGKTTLAKSLSTKWSSLYYLNYDADKDKSIMRKQEWDREAPLVVLDEFHKLKNWKSKLKGIYDTEGIPPRILVTGSARLDLYRRGSDSLAGRYFLHRLYPFSVRELQAVEKPEKILPRLMQFGGFPEPFLSQSEVAANRWRKNHLERIVREDIQDLEPVKDLQALLLLIELLRERIGSTISYASLARDIEVSPHTVKRWIQILENMYVLFRVSPYHRNLARAIIKEPKVYFYDTGAVRGNDGARLENIIAVCLRKWLHYLEDAQGNDTQLHFVRDKDGHEVDFVVVENRNVTKLIEVKLSDTTVSRNLQYFKNRIRSSEAIQLVMRQKRRRAVEKIQVWPAADWLATLDI